MIPSRDWKRWNEGFFLPIDDHLEDEDEHVASHAMERSLLGWKGRGRYPPLPSEGATFH